MKAFNLKSILTKGGTGNQDVIVEMDGKLFEIESVVNTGEKKVINIVPMGEKPTELVEEVIEISETPTEPKVEEPTEGTGAPATDDEDEVDGDDIVEDEKPETVIED